MTSNKRPLYSVRKGNEVLIATFSEEDDGVLIHYRRGNETQFAIYRNSAEIKATNHLSGYLGGYERLGPLLRKKLPEGWKKKLGYWLMSDKEKSNIWHRRILEEECLQALKTNYPVVGPESIGKGNYAIPTPESKANNSLDWTKDLKF